MSSYPVYGVGCVGTPVGASESEGAAVTVGAPDGAYVSVVGAYDGASVTRVGAYVSARVGAAVTVGFNVSVVGAIVGASE